MKRADADKLMERLALAATAEGMNEEELRGATVGLVITPLERNFDTDSTGATARVEGLRCRMFLSALLGTL